MHTYFCVLLPSRALSLASPKEPSDQGYIEHQHWHCLAAAALEFAFMLFVLRHVTNTLDVTAVGGIIAECECAMQDVFRAHIRHNCQWWATCL